MGALPLLLPRRAGMARRAVFGLIAVIGVLLLCVVAVFSDLSEQCAATSPYDAGMSDAVPAVYVPMYQQSASVFGVSPHVLAALHKQETDFGRSRLPGVTSGVNAFGCCAGPMQFNLRDTWAGHATAYREGTRPSGDYPQRSSRHPSVYDPFDAIMAAGHKLRSDGADTSIISPGTRRAILAYNRSTAYVAAVLADAQRFQRADNNRADTPRARLAWPTEATTITSAFGPRSSPCAGCSSEHQGIDIAAPAGAPVRAAAPGRLISRASVAGYGNRICIRHAERLVTCYAHLDRFGPQPLGTTVTTGEMIGTVGATGSATGPHLHFETRHGTTPSSPPVDPMGHLSEAQPVEPGVAAACGAAHSADPTSGADRSELMWPTIGGRVIGGSNLPGSTHDPAAWPAGWQSDNALDIAVSVGTSVRAVADGTVCDACGFGPSSSRSPRLAGQRLTLSLDGNAVFYAHLSRIAVRPGQRVIQGQTIGYSGSANGVPHLHVALQHGRPEALLVPAATEAA